MRGKSNPRVLTRTNDGENCQLQAQRQPRAEGAASIELASGAEEAPTAIPEALRPWAYRKAGRRRKTPPQGKARREVETPRKDMGERTEALLQSKCDALPRRDTNEGALATWDPGGGAAEQILDVKRPVEAKKNDTADINAHNKVKDTSQAVPLRERQPRTWSSTIIPFCLPEPPSSILRPTFILSPIQKRAVLSEEVRRLSVP